MGGGVDQDVIESVDFAAEGLRIPGLRLLRRVEGLPGVPGAASGRFGKLSRSILELSWVLSEVSKGRFWRWWNQLA